MNDVHHILKERFGYDSFRAGQGELIDAILSGRDCVGVMPTGAGKSLCYQVPALALPGFTLVISPLVSLMHDQVNALVHAGIPAAYLNSQLAYFERDEVMWRASNGEYKLLYVAPERLTDPAFVSFARDANIPLVAVDEAHCVSQWGQDFRPSYLGIAHFIEQLGEAVEADAPSTADDLGYGDEWDGWNRQDDWNGWVRQDEWGNAANGNTSVPPTQQAGEPLTNTRTNCDNASGLSQNGANAQNAGPKRPVVAAFTATATPLVSRDIARLLELHDPFTLTTGFDRPNLRFEVEQLSDKRKRDRLVAFVREHAGESGIVYCATRKQVEAAQELLADAGVPATRYHAGLSADERTRNQRAFVNDDAPVIVATNAFGMGIDKSNVRYVVHFNMPGSLEAYYQEAGRAGRDGEPSVCLLLWNDSDIATARYFVEQDTENEALSPEELETVRSSQRRRLAAMSGYCLTTDCLRATILRYFGETPETNETPAGQAQAARSTSPQGTLATDERAARPGDMAGLDNATPSNRDSEAMHDVEAVRNAEAVRDSEAARGAQAVRGCGNCSNCSEGASVGRIDVTVTARSVMRCVHELRGRYGKGVVADVLTGSKNARIMQWGLDRKRTYNIVDDPAATVKEIIELLAAGGYLEISEGRYPLVGLGPRCREAATDEFRLYMKRKTRRAQTRYGAGASSGVIAIGGAGGAGSAANGAGAGAGATAGSGSGSAAGAGGTSRATAASGKATTLDTPEQRDLFKRLRTLRKRLADDEGVPPYVVFSDATLRNMCVALPRNDDEFLAVSGVGQVKLKRYGAAFLAEINDAPDR